MEIFQPPPKISTVDFYMLSRVIFWSKPLVKSITTFADTRCCFRHRVRDSMYFGPVEIDVCEGDPTKKMLVFCGSKFLNYQKSKRDFVRNPLEKLFCGPTIKIGISLR